MILGIIGTGTMGVGIAQVFAKCAEVEKVLICKSRPSSSRNGKEYVAAAYNRLLSRGRITQDQVNLFMSKIEAVEYEQLTSADLIIEAAFEDLSIKQEVFRRLDPICKDNCIFATNTSSIPIQMIAEGINRPLIGMHFFNPAPVMHLVELIVTEKTSQELIQNATNIIRRIGKTPVVVREAPGFIVNRILIPMINEAISIYAEGIATVEDIDTAMKLGANHPIGPLALGDLIGLDIVLAIMNVMLKETGENKYVPQPMLKRMVREGKLGRKTGEGFYKY